MFRIAALLCLLAGPAFAQDIPKMKFNEVKEIAPGVFFRYSAISPDNSVPFGGSNNIWIVFEDYVVVYDANFPKEAGDVVAAVKKTTDKPIRYVLDSHHHGDHAYGNAVFAKLGATIVAQANCARLLRIDGPEQFAKAGEGPMARKDVAASELKVPSLIFDDKLVLDDGKQRVEFLFYGHAHTAGDAVAYLPHHKILCTGDACTNGPYNYTGHADTASWIRVLDRLQQLDVKLICPGHGPLAGPELLKKQQRFFVELRAQIQAGIDKNLAFDDIARSLDMPWQKEWTTVDVKDRKENIRDVYDELTGRVKPWDLFEDFGIYEGPSPTKTTAGWSAPKRIVVPNLMPAKLLELKRIAPDVLFVPVKDIDEAAKEAATADAVIGFCNGAIARANPKLRWIQAGHTGVEKDLEPDVVKSGAVVTNTARLYGANVADQGMALVLALSRGIRSPSMGQWVELKQKLQTEVKELRGQTMVVVGLGGIGTQIARRAEAFGMRVIAVDPNEKIVRPSFVLGLHPPSKLPELLPQADVLVLACPLTEATRGLIGLPELQKMKKSAYLVNIARGGLVKTADLVKALDDKIIAGAGLDVTDPEPLGDDHPLWRRPNVVISPHIGGQSPGADDRRWRLFRENLRRFVAGEPLVCVVDKAKGY